MGGQAAPQPGQNNPSSSFTHGAQGRIHNQRTLSQFQIGKQGIIQAGSNGSITISGMGGVSMTGVGGTGNKYNNQSTAKTRN